MSRRSPASRASSARRTHARARVAAGICVLVAAALPPVGATGAAARNVTPPATGPSVAPARPPLAATVTSCATGLNAADRTAVFSGSMPTIRRATSMAMRFELYARHDETGSFSRLRVPGFSSWVRSDANVAGFVYDKRVQQLAAPSAYRVLVHFRWYDAHGHVVRRTERTSSSCREPDLRPDLQIAALVIGPARADGTAPYAVTVRNAGLSAVSAPFATALTVGGVLQPLLQLPALDAGASTTMTFSAPACTPGQTVGVAVDADGVVPEADEADDVLRRPCAVG